MPDLRHETGDMKGWRVVYDPKADVCLLLPPGAEAEIPSGAWVTVVR